jgi:hypothetical protein
MNKQTKIAMVLDALKGGASLTSMDAVKMFDYYRLGSGIHKLRRQGYAIKSDIVKSGNGAHYARYSLEVDHV